MHLYKWLGLLLVIGCGLFCGAGLAFAERRRVHRAKGYLHLLGFMREQLNAFSCPMGEAFSRAPRALLDECGAAGGEFHTFSALLEATKAQLSRPVAALLHEICERRGSTERRVQLQRLDEDIARLQHLCVGLAAELEGREQVAFCLPATLAAMLAVLLL